MRAGQLRVVISLCVLSSFCTSAISDWSFEMPPAAGKFAASNKCPRLIGRFLTKGECLSGVCEAAVLSLSYILSVPFYPPQNMQFGKDDRRYADLSIDDSNTLRADLAIGDYVTKWETQDFTCQQGWLKLTRLSEGGAEGNHTKAVIVSYLRQNIKGDLIVFHKVQGRTTNFFGLVSSNIDDQGWLVFKQDEKTKINGVTH